MYSVSLFIFLAEGEGLEPYAVARTPKLCVALRRGTLPRSPPALIPKKYSGS